MIRKILCGGFSICLGIFLLHILWKAPSNISPESRSVIEQELSILTLEEKENMEALFAHFFFFDAFSYPLFGSKPMSIGLLLDQFQKGWTAWIKIAHLFHSEKFVIADYIFNDNRFVLIANLDLVEKVYFENKAIFDQTFEGRMTMKDLKLCLKERNALFQELMRNDLILGILLGYGTRNAQVFAAQEPMKPFTSVHPVFYYFSKILPPYFACDPQSEETIELKRRYKQEWATIVKMSERDPLFLQMLVLLKE